LQAEAAAAELAELIATEVVAEGEREQLQVFMIILLHQETHT
jgi:hypothetical protein